MRILKSRAFKVSIGICAVFVLVGYGLFQARLLLQGPEISITSPKNGTTLHSSMVTIEGNVSNIKSIQMNDRGIYVNEAGNFSEPVVLSNGYNIITVEVEDRFGHKKTEIVEIVHEPISGEDSPLSQQSEKQTDPNEPS